MQLQVEEAVAAGAKLEAFLPPLKRLKKATSDEARTAEVISVMQWKDLHGRTF
jgi:hypothetical protein